MIKWGYDEPNGTIIGGEYFEGKLYYDNRQQGRSITADNQEELIAQAEIIVSDYKKEFCSIGLYPDNSKWELRIS